MFLKITKLLDGWWISREDGTQLCGPYTHRYEAEDDLRGLERWYKAREKEAKHETSRKGQ